MTYHLFETEVQSISSLNGEALRYFSIGAFLLGIGVNTSVGYILAVPPLSEFGHSLVRWGIGVAFVLSVLCYLLGGWAIWTKRTIIEQIKRETVAK